MSVASGSVKWQKYSYLLDFKPLADRGNIFVDCGDAEQHSGSPKKRKQLAIQKSKLILSIGSQKDVQNLNAYLTSVTIDPEFSTSLQWADAHTLEGAVSVANTELGDNDLHAKSEVVRYLADGTGTPKQLKSTKEFFLVCRICNQHLTSVEHTFTNIVSLPQDDWEEIAGDWFCHGTQDECAKLHNLRQMTPAPEDMFVNETFVVVNSKGLTNVDRKDPGGTLHCNRCGGEVGSQMLLRKIPTGAMKLYLLCVDVVPKDNQAIPSPYSTVIARFASNVRYYSWVLLKQREAHSSLKIAVRTLTGEPRLLIWLLDGFSFFVRGTLVADDQPIPKGPKYPIPVLKMLYKIIEKGQDDDPRVSGQDASIAPLDLPLMACTELTELLLHSTQALPRHMRTIGTGQFFVGFLEMDKSL